VYGSVKYDGETDQTRQKLPNRYTQALVKYRGFFCVSYSTLGAGRHLYYLQWLNRLTALSGSSFLCPERGFIFQLVWLGRAVLWLKS
jgi:hypothetical protein